MRIWTAVLAGSLLYRYRRGVLLLVVAFLLLGWFLLAAAPWIALAGVAAVAWFAGSRHGRQKQQVARRANQPQPPQMQVICRRQ